MASLREGSVHSTDRKDMGRLEKAGESFVVENPGEVFDQGEYRALGWYAHPHTGNYGHANVSQRRR
jgi:hypothetical protein